MSDVYSRSREYIDNLKATEMYKDVPITLDEREAFMMEHNKPFQVMHPMKELMNLYFNIELKEMIDPENGERVLDWDTFWAQREAIQSAIPEEYIGEWEAFLGRNNSPLEQLRFRVNSEYFRRYNLVWDGVLRTYDEEQQKLINEYLHLQRTGQSLDRQAMIKAMVTGEGKLLISSFQTDISEARQALRYKNPHLDAWLFYFGKVSTFLTPEAETVYNQLAKDTGKVI